METETLTPASAPELRRGLVAVERRVMTVPLVDARIARTGEADGDWLTLLGHAAVIGQTTTLYKTDDWQITEEIMPGAFDRVLASSPDVHLNVNHDMARVLARTGIDGVGSLELTLDDVGLRMFAKISPKISYAQDLAELMRSGVVDQASFAFRIGSEELTTRRDSDGYETDHFRILEVSELFDVTVCAQGAYPTTDAILHSRALAAGRTSRWATNSTVEPPEAGEASTISVAPVVGAEQERARRLASMRAKARIAKLAHHRSNP